VHLSFREPAALSGGVGEGGEDTLRRFGELRSMTKVLWMANCWSVGCSIWDFMAGVLSVLVKLQLQY
jgi:hypothetical protein